MMVNPTAPSDYSAGRTMLSYPRIFIAAGEHSGDRFGAALAGAILRRRPDARLSGVGGPRMSGAGVRLLADTTVHAGMGLFYALKGVNNWARIFRRCVADFNHEAPDVIVPIDNPGFNLRLAEFARGHGVPVCYYVSPQVWAWMPHRIHRIGRIVDRMMTILPFEKRLYDEIGVDCRYVGHPALDYMPQVRLDERFVSDLRAGDAMPVALLPGSRRQEVRHTFPILCDAALVLQHEVPGLVFHVGAADWAHIDEIKSILSTKGLTARVHLGRTAELMKGSRICLIVSGTATLEAAFYRTPMVIVYRAGAWARHLAPLLLRVRHISLVNIVAGREAVPEFLKFDDDALPVARAAQTLLTDRAEWEKCRQSLEEVMTVLGPGGSCERAAEAVLEMAR